MPAKAKVRWHSAANAWRSDVGPIKNGGRRTPVYFREIANSDKGRRVAEARLDEYLRARDADEAARTEAGSGMTVGHLVVAYLAYLKARVEAGERSAETYRSSKERLERFASLPGPGGRAIGELRASSFGAGDEAHRALDDLKAGGCGAVRVKGVLRTCHAAFEWAATPQRGRDPRQIIPANPFRGIKGDEVVRSARTIIERPQLASFLRAARRRVAAGYPLESGECGACRFASKRGGRVYGRKGGEACRRPHGVTAAYDRATAVLVLLQFYLGTRPSELCRAEWGLLDLKTDGGQAVKGWEPRAWKHPETGRWWGLLTLYGKTTRATGRLRKIPVKPGLVKWVERVRGLGLHERWIFPRRGRSDGSGDGSWTTSALDAWVRKRRRAAGLPEDFTLYAARHGMYTRAVGDGGLTGEQAGSVGGTSGDVVRRVYLQQDTRAIFESAERIDRVSRRKAR
jgi:integrase